MSLSAWWAVRSSSSGDHGWWNGPEWWQEEDDGQDWWQGEAWRKDDSGWQSANPHQDNAWQHWESSRDKKALSQSEVWFLRQHEIRDHRSPNLTHNTLLGVVDCLTKSGKFFFEDDPFTQKMLARCVANSYRAGSDQTLCFTERNTGIFPFIVDVDVEGSPSSSRAIPSIAQDNKWLEVVLTKMCMKVASLYGGMVRCLAYNASGPSREKGLFKVSYHLVFPDILVDKAQAVKLRHTIVVEFERSAQHLLTQVQSLRETNSWHNVFDSCVTNDNHGMRMPYCDKAFRNPDGSRHRENRPLLAIGEYQFQEDQLALAIPEFRHPFEYWIQAGSCRRPKNAVVTRCSTEGLEQIQPAYTTVSTRGSQPRRGQRQPKPHQKHQQCITPPGINEQSPPRHLELSTSITFSAAPPVAFTSSTSSSSYQHLGSFVDNSNEIITIQADNPRTLSLGLRFSGQILMGITRFFPGNPEEFVLRVLELTRQLQLPDPICHKVNQGEAIQLKLGCAKRTMSVLLHTATGTVVLQGTENLLREFGGLIIPWTEPPKETKKEKVCLDALPDMSGLPYGPQDHCDWSQLVREAMIVSSELTKEALLQGMQLGTQMVAPADWSANWSGISGAPPLQQGSENASWWKPERRKILKKSFGGRVYEELTITLRIPPESSLGLEFAKEGQHLKITHINSDGTAQAFNKLSSEDAPRQFRVADEVVSINEVEGPDDMIEEIEHKQLLRIRFQRRCSEEEDLAGTDKTASPRQAPSPPLNMLQDVSPLPSTAAEWLGLWPQHSETSEDLEEVD